MPQPQKKPVRPAGAHAPKLQGSRVIGRERKKAPEAAGLADLPWLQPEALAGFRDGPEAHGSPEALDRPKRRRKP